MRSPPAIRRRAPAGFDFEHRPSLADIGFRRRYRRFPYVPNRPEQLDSDCYEAFNIQVQGLARRFQATSGSHLVIGVSGGLDSTHALIVAAKMCDFLKLPRTTILGFTMPGFATGDTTKGNAWALMKALGIVGEEIDIRPAAMQMLKDMGHPFASGQPVYDIAFENVQAGLRTDYLFRLANQRRGFVIGTGNLSEVALGWSTYGVGDQMSHYGVNAGVPKTLIQYLIRWAVKTGQFDSETNRILEAILATKISPELIPADDKGEMQSTEGTIGPYELHDFFLFHILRSGQPPSKVAFLAWQAWRDAEQGQWPLGYPEAPEARLRPADHPQVAGGLPLPLLPDQPVQAHRHPQLAQGLGGRSAQPTGRLARAERRRRRALARRAEGGVRGLTRRGRGIKGSAVSPPGRARVRRSAGRRGCPRHRKTAPSGTPSSPSVNRATSGSCPAAAQPRPAASVRRC